AAAINHLDVFVIGGRPRVTIPAPGILGTDAGGIVDQVGADVKHVKVGDRVVVNPGISDRSCEYCRAGEHPLCVKFAVLGEHVPGTIAEYVVLPGANVRPIPNAVSDEQAAAFTLAALTAWRMVRSRAGVTKADEVL